MGVASSSSSVGVATPETPAVYGWLPKDVWLNAVLPRVDSLRAVLNLRSTCRYFHECPYLVVRELSMIDKYLGMCDVEVKKLFGKLTGYNVRETYYWLKRANESANTLGAYNVVWPFYAYDSVNPGASVVASMPPPIGRIATEMADIVSATREADSLIRQVMPLDGIHSFIVRIRAAPTEEDTIPFLFHFSERHPFKPPLVRCMEPPFHPSFNPDTGIIQIAILRTDWSPALWASKVMITIASLLSDSGIIECLQDPVYCNQMANEQAALYYREMFELR